MLGDCITVLMVTGLCTAPQLVSSALLVSASLVKQNHTLPVLKHGPRSLWSLQVNKCYHGKLSKHGESKTVTQMVHTGQTVKSAAVVGGRLE